MLALYEGSSGQVVEVATEHPRGFLVLVGAADDGERRRALLVADLIRRIVDWRGRQALVFSLTDGGAEGEDLAELNVHPPNRAAGTADVAGQRFDVCIGEVPGSAVARHALTVAGIERPGGGSGTSGAGGDLLAVRLVLLGTRYREAVTVDDRATAQAEQLLGRWRERVATWALSPSGAPASRYLDAIVGAFENDLDTPAALRELTALEADETVEDGAKFETFAAADRLLGLDVASQVGRGLRNDRSVLRAFTQRIAVRTHDHDMYMTSRTSYP